MDRKDVEKQILELKEPNILCELPTSFGKTKIALELLHLRCNNKSKILIVIPRLVLIETWKAEFRKWKMSDFLKQVEFVTYVSFPKKAGSWDMIIFDEAHHLSERCRESLDNFNIKYSILLSATVGRDLKESLRVLFKNLYVYKISTKKAIEDKVLPDPKVFLIPMKLDNTKIECEIIKNPKVKDKIIISYAERWKYIKVKNKQIIIKCTQQQYYDEISSLILWYKNKMYDEHFKVNYLRKSGERLKWLSNQKTPFIISILKKLDKERTLTFCNSILHTEVLGTHCINSKNISQSRKNLLDFNNGEINHITACDMINEGINLKGCKVGVYAALNSSERLIVQKNGRLLRHPNPIIIIPYYVNTRDEEIVKKMLENYNSKLVNIINNLNELII